MLVISLVLALLCGCSENTQDTGSNETNATVGTSSDNTNISSEATTVTFAQSDDAMFTNRDYEVGYDTQNCVLITLNETGASSSSDSVKISGSTVTITEEETYIISGSLSDGMIIVDADESAKLQIVLNGVNITSSTSAALYILEADKVFVTLADSTENFLTNGGTFEAIDDNNIDGAIYSKQDLTFNGNGSLTVTSPAGHGIVCKDDLVFTSGTYSIASSSHGLDVNDSVRIANAQISIEAGKDGIQAENSDNAELGFVYMSSGVLNIGAEGDGISAQTYLQIEGGTLDLLCGGGSENGSQSSSSSYGDFRGGMGGMGGMGGKGNMGFSSSSSSSSSSSGDSTSMKGLKASGNLLISGGTITINSADDALHANDSMTINGGIFEIASGDDAVHAENTLTITDCTMNITECYEGLEALKIYVRGGDIKLVASDDGINAAGGTDSSGMGGRDAMFGGGMMGGSSSSNGYIEISGGKLSINSSGDGIDANGSFLISGGYTVIVGPTNGDTATLDYDREGKITGGTFIGTGASGMAQTFSSSSQGVIAVSVGSVSANTEIRLTDAKGNLILSHTPELSFAVVILSSPDIVSGESYTITVGAQSGTFEAS